MQSCVVLYRSSSRAAPASSSSALGRTFGGASFLLFTFGEGENSFHFEVKPGRGTRARARAIVVVPCKALGGRSSPGPPRPF